MEHNSDVDLIQQYRSGDRRALTQLFERQYSASLRLARTILRSDDDCRDAVQSAFLSAFRHIDSYRGDASFGTWVKRIVINSCLMQMRRPDERLRRRTRERVESTYNVEVLVSNGQTPEDTTWGGEIRCAHSTALQTLPGKLRGMYTLCVVSGLTVAEAADRLGTTLPAAKSRLFRARAQMRELLRDVWRPEQSQRAA